MTVSVAFYVALRIFDYNRSILSRFKLIPRLKGCKKLVFDICCNVRIFTFNWVKPF